MDKEKLPHSQSALTLGIVSIIVACCCFNIIGIVYWIYWFKPI